MRSVTRRTALITMVAALAARPALGEELAPDAARAHVEATVEAILHLIVANRPPPERAAALRQILMEMTSLPHLAQFAAGRNWRDMSDTQRAAFVDAFARYIARVYAGYFRSFEGSIDDLRAFVNVLGVQDAGRKGILVASEIRPLNQVAISVNWLVSDRSGKLAIADLVVEGISLAVTQREILAAMFEKHDGDAERVISELDGSASDELR